MSITEADRLQLRGVSQRRREALTDLVLGSHVAWRVVCTSGTRDGDRWTRLTGIGQRGLIIGRSCQLGMRTIGFNARLALLFVRDVASHRRGTCSVCGLASKIGECTLKALPSLRGMAGV